MTDEDRRLLADVLVIEVLSLAFAMKANKESQGSYSSSDFTKEAVSLIKQKREQVLSLLASDS